MEKYTMFMDRKNQYSENEYTFFFNWGSVYRSANDSALICPALCGGSPLLCSSVGKESTCNAGDPSSFSGSGNSPGEGFGYPLQYCWASLVAQMVKNLPAMQETWVQSLGWEDPLEEDVATYSRVLAWRIPMDRGAWQAIVHGVTKSQTRLSD